MFPTIAAETKLCKKFNIQEDCQSTSAGHHISAALFGQTTSCALFAQATTLPRPMCSSTQLNWKREKIPYLLKNQNGKLKLSYIYMTSRTMLKFLIPSYVLRSNCWKSL